MSDSKPPIPEKPRRRFPRTDLATTCRLSLAQDKRRQFQATLRTANIGVGGLFVESSFFIKLGTVLHVELELPDGRPVRAKGAVVRVESVGTRTGFAVRFTEYHDGCEVALASYFLAPRVREFVRAYAKRNRFEFTADYLASAADLLAAWELEKLEAGDAWAALPAPSRPRGKRG